MVQLKTRSELKQEVKDLYHGQWKTAIKLNLFPIVLGIITRWVISLVVAISTALIVHMINKSSEVVNYSSELTTQSHYYPGFGSNGGSIIWTFIVALITMSIMFTSIDWLRTKQAPQSILRESFSVFSKRYFLGALVIEVLTYVFTFLWTLLLIVPGIIKTYSYSQAPYIFKDWVDADEHDNINYFDCITRSRRLMNGQKWHLFVLQLSF